MVNGRSPRGESLPPSKLKPNPVPSFLSTTVRGDPRGTSTNFKSKNFKIKTLKIHIFHQNYVIFYTYLTKEIYYPMDSLKFSVVVRNLSNYKMGNPYDHRRPLPESLIDSSIRLGPLQLLVPIINLRINCQL